MKKVWKKYRLRLGLALLFTLIGSVLRASNFVGFRIYDHWIWGIVSFVLVLVLWEAFERIHFYLNKKYPFSRNVMVRIALQTLCNWVVLVLPRWTSLYFAEKHLPFTLNHVNYVMIIAIDIISAVGLTMAITANYYFRRWREGLVRNERLEKDKALLQIHNLRNRVNPHFLFNALSALDGLIKTEPELASRFLQHLSKVYRYSLQHEDRDSVSLETELGVFRHFISLLEMRYGSALQFEMNITPDALDRGIVPLTLELLTENALKHNEISDEHPLYIRIYVQDDELLVENPMRKKRTMETSNGKGLGQLQNLYAYLSDRPFMAEEDDRRFTVKVPLL